MQNFNFMDELNNSLMCAVKEKGKRGLPDFIYVPEHLHQGLVEETAADSRSGGRRAAAVPESLTFVFEDRQIPIRKGAPEAGLRSENVREQLTFAWSE